MKIDNTLLKKLEKLSMIKIENRDEMINDLNQIVKFIEVLNEVNTENIDASFNVLKTSTPMRNDIPKNNDAINIILENAPKSEQTYFIVPKIIEG